MDAFQSEYGRVPCTAGHQIPAPRFEHESQGVNDAFLAGAGVSFGVHKPLLATLAINVFYSKLLISLWLFKLSQ